MDYVDALLIMEDSAEDSDPEVEHSEDTENTQSNDTIPSWTATATCLAKLRTTAGVVQVWQL